MGCKSQMNSVGRAGFHIRKEKETSGGILVMMPFVVTDSGAIDPAPAHLYEMNLFAPA